jgi:hypothetical protein
MLSWVPSSTEVIRISTSTDDGDEVGVVFGLLLNLGVDGKAVLIQVIAHQPEHNFRFNALYVGLMQ